MSTSSSDSRESGDTSAESDEVPAELVLVAKGIRYKLTREVTRIGRLPQCEVVLEDDDRVSRVHAEIRRSSKGYVLQDLSHNGSRVNGQKVKRALLHDGDELRIGKKHLTFYDRNQSRRLRQQGSERKVGQNLDLLKELYDEVADNE